MTVSGNATGTEANIYHLYFIIKNCVYINNNSNKHLAVRRSQWPRGLRRRSAAARLLKSWVRIPPGAWMFVCCECCVLSGRGLCNKLITHLEESYWLWRVVCDLETSRMSRPWPALGHSTTQKKKIAVQSLSSGNQFLWICYA